MNNNSTRRDKMHKNILTVVGITILFLGLAIAPLTQGKEIRESDNYHNELNLLLKFYGLNIGSTIKEFKHLLYKLVTKRHNTNASLLIELKNDIVILSNVFEQIGIKEDMKISQALPLIKNNKDIFQERGINLFCVIRIYGHPGNGLPYFQLFKVLFGIWQLFWGGLDDNIGIYNPLIGLQHCEGRMCKETSGKFIGLFTFIPPAIYTPTLPVTPLIIINGFFTLFSISNVPFVENENASQQSQCPCYKKI